MCGITGLSLSHPMDWAERRIAEMTSSIRHRGPDSDGHFANTAKTAWLGFRRLAIRDLDPRANQPMISASGRTVVVFNGEIYNIDELTAKFLPGVTLRTTGDTEVFLEAFERHGLKIFAECNGMFGAAFLDIASGRLTLVRDRMGKKPLFLFEGNDFIAFGSELRTLRPFGLEPDPEQLPYYFHFGWFPAPLTFFKKTTQVRPGESVTIANGRIESRHKYHDFTDWAWGTKTETEVGVDGLNELDALVADAVKRRTLSDVPIGAFLSGGIDSSLVAAYLQATGHRDLPMFTVAISDKNEAPYAAEIARQLDLSHTILPFDSDSLLSSFNQFHDTYEQPYTDSSGLPSMLLCKAVKQHVTVALCGDGGDEFFGGYQRYDWFQQALRAQQIPSVARALLGRIAPLVDRRRGMRIQRLLETRDEAGLYATIINSWTCPQTLPLTSDLNRNTAAPEQLVRDLFARMKCDSRSKAACFDATYYIPEDLQVKLDRASMQVALEVRSPLLDVRVARWGAELVPSVKYRSGPKSVLRDLLARHVPRPLFERQKQGFSIPLRTWLRGPLRDTVHETLNQRVIRESGWLDTNQVDLIEARFQQGNDEYATPLWSLFVLAHNLLRSAAAQVINISDCSPDLLSKSNRAA